MVHIVVAKYNENVDWVKHIQHRVTVYDKSEKPIENSIPLKNKGREGETFLYHIVHHYDHLDDVTVFLQGNPFEHLQTLVGWRTELTDEEKQTVLNKVNKEINDQSDFATFYQVLYNDPNGTNNQNITYYCKKYYNSDYFFFTVSPGAQYIVPKRYILSRPLEFWKTLHEAMYNEELDGYAQEQLWYFAFNHQMNLNVGDHDMEKQKCLERFSMEYTPFNYHNK
jgi:hypothetical protein